MTHSSPSVPATSGAWARARWSGPARAGVGLLALGAALAVVPATATPAQADHGRPGCVTGSIAVAYHALGGRTGHLGDELTCELPTPVRVGRYNHFQGGSIYWSSRTGAHEVRGAIRDRWAAMGWESSPLGFPTTHETPTPTTPGRYNHFEGGSIYWTAGTGAHAVYGSIRQLWAALGWENSALGFPTSSEYAIPGGRRSDFQGGSITWTPAGGAVAETGRPAAPTASALLAGLPVRPEQRSGYRRELFLPEGWADADGDGCTTRREVLIEESQTPVTVRPGCSLRGGRWLSSYDGVTHTDLAALEVDHVVALAEAWHSGAHAWDPARRAAFANDLGFPGSLRAVTAAVNQDKEAQDAAQWLPPRASEHCAYARDVVAVKHRWGLSVDQPERDRLAGLLAGACGQAPVAVDRA